MSKGHEEAAMLDSTPLWIRKCTHCMIPYGCMLSIAARTLIVQMLHKLSVILGKTIFKIWGLLRLETVRWRTGVVPRLPALACVGKFIPLSAQKFFSVVLVSISISHLVESVCQCGSIPGSLKIQSCLNLEGDDRELLQHSNYKPVRNEASWGTSSIQTCLPKKGFPWGRQHEAAETEVYPVQSQHTEKGFAPLCTE